MPTTIHDILGELRASALDERDKGDKFERLIQAYLKVDVQYADQYSEVWLWSEFPGRDNKPDTGIDLVAKDRETGEHTAIQCKFYAPDHYLQKSDRLVLHRVGEAGVLAQVDCVDDGPVVEERRGGAGGAADPDAADGRAHAR